MVILHWTMLRQSLAEIKLLSTSLYYCRTLKVSSTSSDSKAKANLLKLQRIKEFLSQKETVNFPFFKFPLV